MRVMRPNSMSITENDINLFLLGRTGKRKNDSIVGNESRQGRSHPDIEVRARQAGASVTEHFYSFVIDAGSNKLECCLYLLLILYNLVLNLPGIVRIVP